MCLFLGNQNSKFAFPDPEKAHTIARLSSHSNISRHSGFLVAQHLLSCWTIVISLGLVVTLFSHLSLSLAAAACEFLDIVELLLQSGADPSLQDQDGCLPEEVTGCKAISLVLQQHTTGKV